MTTSPIKTVIIHGQSHQGSTCQIARMLAEKIGGETAEFFLPRDFGQFCTGCTACFVKGEDKCPHHADLAPITGAIDAADVLILASPVYVFHATGAMKNLLDHYGWRWMAHRPDAIMFRKQGVCIATAAGAGMKSTMKDMEHSLFYWGVGQIEKLGMGVAAVDWNGVSAKKKAALEKKTAAIAARLKFRAGRVTPSLKTKAMFNIMRMVQKHGWNPLDVDHWKNNGWLGKARPWKQERK